MAESRAGRSDEPFTLDDLAAALRGMPRDALFYIETPDGLAPLIGLLPTHTSNGAAQPSESGGTAGRYSIVLRAGPVRR